MIRILLAHDHAVTREGLRLLLEEELNAHVIAETTVGKKIASLAAATVPDLLVLDLHDVDASIARMLHQIRRRLPRLGIVGLTRGRLGHVPGLDQAVDAYVLRDHGVHLLRQAVRQALAGKPGALHAVPSHTRRARTIVPSLTPREVEIIRLIAQGLTNPQIAGVLSVSVLTVRKHRQNLMHKLELRNAAHIAAFAIRHGLYRSD